MRRPTLEGGRLITVLPRLIRVATFLALALFPAALAAQIVPPGYDQGLFEIRLAELQPTTINVLVSPAGAVMIPVSQILSMTGLPLDSRRGDTLVAIPRVRGGTSQLDWSARRIVRGDSTIVLDSTSVLHFAGETYLTGEAFTAFLEAPVVVDFSALAVTITRDPPFPAQQAALTALRRGAADRRLALHVMNAPVDAHYAGGTGGAVFAWSLGAAGTPGSQTQNGELRTGLALFGGDLAVGAHAISAGAGTNASTGGDWSYRRLFPEREWFREVDVGDIVAGGPLLRSIRGLSLTNERLYPDQFFSDVPLAPNLPTGWQYEVYQNGALIGYANAGQTGGVLVPLRYGSTPVEVHFIGPAGQEIRSNFLYQVPAAQLQPGRIQYHAGLGQCANGCDGLGFGDVSWGARQWLTVGSGVQAMRDSAGTRVTPSFSLAASRLDGEAVQLQIVPSYYSRLVAQYFGQGPFSASTQLSLSDPAGGVASVVGIARQYGADAHVLYRLSQPWRTVTGLRTDLTAEGPTRGADQQVQFGLTADYRLGYFGLTMEHDGSARENLFGVQDLSVLTLIHSGPFANAALTGSALGNGRGVRLATAGLTMNVGLSGAINLTADWRAGSPFALSLGYGTAFPFARLTARAAQDAGRAATGSMTLSGAAIVDSHRQAAPLFVSQGGIGNAGIAGRVFYDNDGDGRYSPGDQPAAGIPVLVAGQRTLTDAAGRYRAWNVVPYEISEVDIDTLRAADASWAPTKVGAYVRATPHTFTSVDFALVRTHELSGSVTADSGIATSAGVTLFLRAAAASDSQRVLTYGDGAFYVSRLRPGAYVLRVAAAPLAALGAISHPDSLPFVISPADTTPIVELPAIHLAPPPPPVRVVAVKALKCPHPPAGVPLDAEGCPIIFREKRTITLRGVNFDLDKATLTPASIAVLTPLAEALASDTSLRIEVAGHTDASGSRVHNVKLSQERADSVLEFFAQHGVDTARMVAHGYGPDQPVATNLTAAGRALNRRTELRRLDHAPPPDEYTVDVARVTSDSAAARLVRRLTTAGFQARIVSQMGPSYVRVGRYPTRVAAQAVQAQLRRKGFRSTQVTVAEVVAPGTPPAP